MAPSWRCQDTCLHGGVVILHAQTCMAYTDRTLIKAHGHKCSSVMSGCGPRDLKVHPRYWRALPQSTTDSRSDLVHAAFKLTSLSATSIAGAGLHDVKGPTRAISWCFATLLLAAEVNRLQPAPPLWGPDQSPVSHLMHEMSTLEYGGQCQCVEGRQYAITYLWRLALVGVFLVCICI